MPTWTVLVEAAARDIRYSLDARPGYVRFLICDLAARTVRAVDVPLGEMAALLDDIQALSR